MFAAGARARAMDLRKARSLYRKSAPHYIENTGDADLAEKRGNGPAQDFIAEGETLDGLVRDEVRMRPEAPVTAINFGIGNSTHRRQAIYVAALISKVWLCFQSCT